MTIYTIGHSTREINEFIALLKSHGVKKLVDVRTIPRSRHNPQYEQEALQKSLPKTGIGYVYMKELGGLRSSIKDSKNTAWRNKSFRNYADYMQTDEFKAGIDALVAAGQEVPTAIMCAEAVPWRCHRSLIGDALVIRGVDVRDIISDSDAKPHMVTSFAKVNGHEITYPGDGTDG